MVAAILALAVAAPRPANPIPPAAIPPAAIAPAEMEPLRITQAGLRTIRDGIGAWLSDQVSRPLSRAGTGCDDPFDVTTVPAIKYPVLEALLVPVYLDTPPELDGWGNPYEFRLAVTNPLAPHVAVVRSAGADATFEGTLYERADTTTLKEDLVVLDLSWLRRPGPALLDPRSRLDRAQREIAMMSAGMLSWVIDQVSRTGALLGEAVDLGLFPPISAADLRSLLIESCTFYYVPYVPELDPWGIPTTTSWTSRMSSTSRSSQCAAAVATASPRARSTRPASSRPTSSIATRFSPTAWRFGSPTISPR